MKKVFEVVRFEVIRNIKKPSFWLASLALPLFLFIYIAIVSVAGYDMGSQLSAGSNIDDIKIAFTDDANYIKELDYQTQKGETKQLERINNREKGIEAIKNEQFDLYFYIPEHFYASPEHPEAESIEIYSKPNKASFLDDYSGAITNFLMSTAIKNIEIDDLSVITHQIGFQNTTYDKNTNQTVDKNEIISRAIIPGIAIVMFYLLICVLGNRLIAAMVEEKENRISELLLTSIKPRNFVLGKIISIMIVGLLQLVILIVPVVIIYFFAKNNGLLPGDFTLNFSFTDGLRYGILLIMSYFLFASFCTLVGIVSPNLKDANSFAGVFVILFILPMIFINIFTNEDNLLLANIFSYLPPTAPLALMFRGVFANISNWGLWLGILDISISGILIMMLSAHIYSHNALGFNPKFNLKKALNAPRKQWKN